MSVSIVIAIAALLFSVFSFWWIHDRKGPLRMSGVPIYSGFWGRNGSETEFTLRLPVVVYNTGSRARVVEELRLRVPAWGDVVMSWEHFAETLSPRGGENLDSDFVSPFPVDPKRVVTKYVDFSTTFDGCVPTVGETRFVVEAKLDRGDRWVELGEAVLHLGHMVHPDSYISYRNSEILCPGETNADTEARWKKHLGIG